MASPYEHLIEAAWKVRENAYAPYSGYKVGAAIEDAAQNVWLGANFENVSFGATICAERAAVAQMIAGGGRQIKRLVLATEDGGSPCGICLQVLSEFTSSPDELEIILVAPDGARRNCALSQLLPLGFRSSEVHRT